ncbi:serine hydrolase-domain-containing protein [Lasiosphaeria miniovina]|uniref:Serine hydrolase-domain-containing protein n=1 Tax=Lasiosphaeria miniovina TaxID=1954250 RepID=A0AA40AD49_9PEZI|nr:serine hydrolase-domain-containing protein [Lasiosphaeria miniovina]KAK0713574.1 serine hydrolase-domain-containing protein [Lasiosphaeria miniovina]
MAMTTAHASWPTAVWSQTLSSKTHFPILGSDSTLYLPRILCLHGGGSNARIFRAQCRALRSQLTPTFRLVFADAPFFSDPGPDVESVYASWGPFRSWLTPQVPFEQQHGFDAERVDASIRDAIAQDDGLGAMGPVVGVLGFSQGARMAASLLFRQQMHGSQGLTFGDARIEFRFAVLLAGRGPLLFPWPSPGYVDTREALLHLPTVHVHGLGDVGIRMHRELLRRCCEKGTARLVEWEGGHRVPIKTRDVAAVVDEMLHAAMCTESIKF